MDNDFPTPQIVLTTLQKKVSDIPAGNRKPETLFTVYMYIYLLSWASFNLSIIMYVLTVHVIIYF